MPGEAREQRGLRFSEATVVEVPAGRWQLVSLCFLSLCCEFFYSDGYMIVMMMMMMMTMMMIIIIN